MDKGTIVATALSIGYRQERGKKKTVQQDLDFSLMPGRLTCLLGPNGAGKSTLLRTLSGAQKPLSGSLGIDGTPVIRLSDREISRRVCVVLTDRVFAGGLTVYEVVSLGRHPHSGFFGRLDSGDRRIVEEALQATGIAHKSNSYFAQLSDGERQKTLIAKALAQESPVILLDEPTAFLDVTSRIEVMNLLRGLAEAGKTILLSTHDMEQALRVADELWLLSKKEGLTAGCTEDVVLAGGIDRYFGKESLRFDLAEGMFLPVRPPGPAIRIVAEGELYHWTSNAVERSGFTVLREGAEEYTPYAVVKADAPDRIAATLRGETIRFDSFAGLCGFLRGARKNHQ